MAAGTLDEAALEHLQEMWRTQVEVGDVLSTAEALHLVLTRAIVEKVLPAGVGLKEELLSQSLGVSRTPVREALTLLKGSELVTRDSRGTLRVQSLTADRILDVYAVREALEALSAHDAALHSTPRAVAELRHLNSLCAKAARAKDFVEMARCNIELHRAIARIGQNSFLIQLIDATYNWVRLMPSTTLAKPGRAREALAQHEELIEAIERRDEVSSERMARQHIADAQKVRVAMLAP